MKKYKNNVRESWKYYKEEIKKACNDLKHKDTFYKQIPNLLTVSRVVGMIPVSILLLTGNVIPGLFVLGLVMSTDFVDGKIARKYGITSSFGADLDAISDKIMAFALMLPLALVNPVIILNIILEVFISFTNVKCKLEGETPKTLFSGKVKTLLLSITLFFGYLSRFLLALNKYFVLLSLVSAIMQTKTCYDYVKKNSSFKKEKDIKKDNDLFKETMKKDNGLEELKRERENLLNCNIEVKSGNRVRKRKK